MGAAAIAFLIVPLVAAPGLGFAAAVAVGAAAFIVFYASRTPARRPSSAGPTP